MAASLRPRGDTKNGVVISKDVPNILPGGEIVAFLPLQVALFFNVCFSPVWFLSSLVAQVYKFSRGRLYTTIPLLVVSVAAGLLEVIRIYLGYEGNLREKVPRLVTFWFLNILQIILISVIIGVSIFCGYLVPMEAAVDAGMLLFLIAQLFLGAQAIRLMVKAQAVKFHLSQCRQAGEEETVSLVPVNARTKVE